MLRSIRKYSSARRANSPVIGLLVALALLGAAAFKSWWEGAYPRAERAPSPPIAGAPGMIAARVLKVMAYYVPQNQATQVMDVTVEPATKESLPTLKDSAAKPRSPVLKLKWKIENPDSDDTTYTLEACRDGEANWRPISTGKAPLTAVTWDWNTETYPDGWYRARVIASDAAANSPDRALTSTATTTMFAIDNTRPSIDALKINYPKAQARASDAISTIAEMAFSVDDGPWQIGTTADGLYDDLTEDLRIDLPQGLARGTHTLAVRVADASGNVGSVSSTFVIK